LPNAEERKAEQQSKLRRLRILERRQRASGNRNNIARVRRLNAGWSRSGLMQSEGNMNSHRAWLTIIIFGAIFPTSASAQAEMDKLRSCLAIEDGSKERLDCYDGIIPPASKPKPPVAKVVADCKFLKEEDERLGCFNRFVVQPAATPKAARKAAPKVQIPK